ncbi:hypothetical protein D9O36_15220 [Zobellia amurskyensis]|uniref:Lipoprotein n=1 Tax=Zobellia amurskyensis TaxID=248905 RepID=A0A7X3D2K5_9FLAO|nr:hypothetical protein [Zobellia amurskyensis]MUH37201.1 hypothetical protein [Zobellia amurskyensis]
MNLPKILSIYTLILLLSTIISCSEDNSTTDPPVPKEQTENPVTDEENESTTEEPKEKASEEEEVEESLEEEEEEEEEETTNNFGTIELSGDETSDVGTELVVGHIAVGRADLTGTEKSVILTDENTEITEEGPEPKNLDKGFVLIGGDDLNTDGTTSAEKDISMVIFIDGEEYRFGCAVPNSGNFIDCGADYNIDFDKKEIVFKETTVVNTDTEVTLTMNGTITWE